MYLRLIGVVVWQKPTHLKQLSSSYKFLKIHKKPPLPIYYTLFIFTICQMNKMLLSNSKLLLNE